MTSLRILVLSSSPKDSSRINGRKIYEKIENQKNSANLSLARLVINSRYCAEISFEKALEEIKNYKPHILHFIGHGDSSYPLMFQTSNDDKQPIRWQSIVKSLGGLNSYQSLKCIIITSCFSKPLAKSLADNHDILAFGKQGELLKKDAEKFTDIFYKELFYLFDVREAWETTKALLQKYKTAKPLDYYPELYLNKSTGLPLITPIPKHPYKNLFNSSRIFFNKNIDSKTKADILNYNVDDFYIEFDGLLHRPRNFLREIWKNNSRKSVLLVAGIQEGKTTCCMSLWKEQSIHFDMPTETCVIYIDGKELSQFINDQLGKQSYNETISRYIIKKYLGTRGDMDEDLKFYSKEFQSDYDVHKHSDYPRYQIVLDGYKKIIGNSAEINKSFRKIVIDNLRDFWITDITPNTQIIITSSSDIRREENIENIENIEFARVKKKKDLKTKLFIFTTTQKHINKLYSSPIKEKLTKRYNSKLEYWKPYSSEDTEEAYTMAKLIQELIEENGFDFVEYEYVTNGLIGQSKRREIEEKIDSSLAASIGIIDILSIPNDNNVHYPARLFNNTQSKGTIFPLCATLKEDFSDYFNDKINNIFHLVKGTDLIGKGFDDKSSHTKEKFLRNLEILIRISDRRKFSFPESMRSPDLRNDNNKEKFLYI